MKKEKTLEQKLKQFENLLIDKVYRGNELIVNIETASIVDTPVIKVNLNTEHGILYSAITEDITDYCKKKKHNYHYTSYLDKVIMTVIIK